MQTPSKPANEALRLATLQGLCVLDASPPEALDRVTRLAARIFKLPIALVSLIDAERQWFASRQGLGASETSRDLSFCGHAILGHGALIVKNALLDERFADNPLVTGPPDIRFYAGYPVFSQAGLPLGTLCLIDRVARDFDGNDLATLRDLAAMVEQYFHSVELDRQAETAQNRLAQTEALFAQTVSQAAAGIALVGRQGQWLSVNKRLLDITGYAEAALRSLTFRELTPEEDRDYDSAQFEKLWQGEVDSYSLEKRYRHAGGHLIWVQLSVAPSRDQAGQVQHLIVVVNDISARKQTEAELAKLREHLEQRVMERTAELSAALARLQCEIDQRLAAQTALEAEKENFRSTLENTIDAFVEIDAAGLVRAWNCAAEQIFGWNRTEAVGRPIAELVIPERLRRAHHAGFERFVLTGESTMMNRRIEINAAHRDGYEFPIELTLSAKQSEGQLRIDAFMHDISQRRAAERETLESHSRLRMIADNMPAMIAYVGADGCYQFTNTTYLAWFGLSTDSLIGKSMQDFLGPDAHARALPHIEQALRGEATEFIDELQAMRGPIVLQTSFVPNIDLDRQVQGFYVLSLDITAQRRLQHHLEYEALHDPLTGLPNRRAFMHKLNESIARARRHREGMAVLFLDLDGFKAINDQYGHEMGDQVLRRFAQLLQSLLRQTDTAARLAGDEFTAILEGLGEPESEASLVAAKLLQTLLQPQQIDGITLQLAVSVGISVLLPDAELAAETLLAQADRAMYNAKQAGKGDFRLH